MQFGALKPKAEVRAKPKRNNWTLSLCRGKNNRNWPQQVGVRKDGNGNGREMATAANQRMELVLIRYRQRNYDEVDSSTCGLELGS